MAAQAATQANRSGKKLKIGPDEVRMGAPNAKNKTTLFLRNEYLKSVTDLNTAEEVFERYFSTRVPAAAKIFNVEEYDILINGLTQRINSLSDRID
jgi:hypothetical protein